MTAPAPADLLMRATWLDQAAHQVPRLRPTDQRHLLARPAGRVALALYRAGLLLLMLDHDWRITIADATRPTEETR